MIWCRRRLDQQDGIELVSRLQFEPGGWQSVETAWPRIGKNISASTMFHACSTGRPAGCSPVTSAAAARAWAKPKSPSPRPRAGHAPHGCADLADVCLAAGASRLSPSSEKLLIVGANDRCGAAVSAHDSIYLNSALPLVSESGSSALVREVAQVFGASTTQRSDWISEGFAEYYAIELVRRAGGMSDERYQAMQAKLTRDSQKVTTLRGEQISPAQLASGDGVAGTGSRDSPEDAQQALAG
jgi:hypothetical protein